MNDFSASLSGKPKLQLLWPEQFNLPFLNTVPHRYRMGRHRSKSRSRAHGLEDITTLQTSFNAWDGIRDLQKHKYRTSDLQYVFLALLALFSLWIAPPAPGLKTLAVLASVWVSFMPATRQFFLPSACIWVWLLYFFCSRFIPNEYRPHIWVRVLPALENVLYGANLSSILSAHKHYVLDILAWLPYGLAHFGAPVVVSLIIFIFAAPGSTPVFARTFGWMSILGVTIQLLFPCTPPWYENEHGLEPAAYGMPGSPAGLARIDEILGFDMYTTNFSSAPVPFGAFPSLHAANAVLEALFMSHCFPQFRNFFIVYAGWVCWATMYLSHHYAIDLVCGGLIATAFFYVAKARWMPQRQEDKMTRWDYDYVEYGNQHAIVDEEYGDFLSLGLLEHRRADSSDGWTVASSSSCSSSSGTLSPTLSEETIPGMLIMGSTEHGQPWDSTTPPRDVELSEVVVVR
ncbi:hypothetical protein B0T10DRAFT_18511 [Thelonectria olida]|uniref:Phosphatidic acid phosphatase type 2/haloperoxidase domain-containing protein n=1 Tax=Thelonectria olida TaxID=1576542 RepID=A0A9P8WIN5_9HYPO|nr:hypothetical protein B0T10DRAFT_18511 [Thelonectria olida]